MMTLSRATERPSRRGKPDADGAQSERPSRASARRARRSSRGAEAVQLSFEDLPKHGGVRPGAGRKRRGGARPQVVHRVRPVHARWKPVHVTLRAHRQTPNLRTQVLARAVEEAVRLTRPEGFRVVQFSTQADHVHALVEADTHEALVRGMRSLSVRIAKRVNRALLRPGLRGKVWGDRYHRHDLTTPREVRNALVYVLANFKKHLGLRSGAPVIDPCSSAPWFQGWVAHRKLPEGDPPVVPAETKLLGVLWQRRGLVHPGERPSAVH